MFAEAFLHFLHLTPKIAATFTSVLSWNKPPLIANKITFTFAFHLLNSPQFLLILYSPTNSYFSTAHKFQTTIFKMRDSRLPPACSWELRLFFPLLRSVMYIFARRRFGISFAAKFMNRILSKYSVQPEEKLLCGEMLRVVVFSLVLRGH